MEDHPKAIGDMTALAVMLAFHEAGLSVMVPFGENTRYDLVVDDGVCLSRIQCKTGRLVRGAVVFKTCSSYAHHPNPEKARRDYLGDIDYFAVYCPDGGSIYVVPVEEVGTCQAALRVEPPRNAQRRRIRDASCYELGSVRVRGGRLREALAARPGAGGSCA